MKERESGKLREIGKSFDDPIESPNPGTSTDVEDSEISGEETI
jgi:hypothetical protein